MKTMMEKTNKTPKVNNSNLIILIIPPRLRFTKFPAFHVQSNAVNFVTNAEMKACVDGMNENHEIAPRKLYHPTEKWEIAKKSESLTKGNVKIGGNSKFISK